MADLNSQGATRTKPRAAKDSKSDEIDRMVDAVMRFLHATKVDRMVYLCISVMSFVVLIGILIYAIAEDKIGFVAAFSMFGATGIVSICAIGVLKVWHDCMSLLRQVLLRDKSQ